MNYGLLIIVLCISAIGSTSAFAVSDNYCLDQMHKGIQCYSYLQSYTVSPPGSNLGWTMDIIAPNNTCNIFGNITPMGACTFRSIVLSDIDFNTLKSNPSVLAVINIQNSAMTAQDYCPVAQWTWDSQDDAFKTKYQSLKNLIIPDRCNTQPIPEFPLVPALILVLSIGGILFFYRVFVMKTSISLI